MNKREIGDSLEDYVLSKLGSGFTGTANSGAKWQDGDIRHPRLVVECKVKGDTEGFTSPKSELKKLWSLADKHGKDWLYIERNKTNKVMVLMDFDSFLEMTEVYRQKFEKESPR